MIAAPFTSESADAAEYSGRRVLITGATGFIGSHLRRALLSLGADVHLLGRADSIEAISERCQTWRADLEVAETVTAAVATVRPDIVFHLASLVDGRQDRDMLGPTLRVNLIGSLNLAAACEAAGVGRLVAVGSCEEPIGPEPAPASPYAAAKASATLYFRMFHRVYGLPVVIVRPGLVYGPEQSARKLIPYTITQLLNGQTPRLSSGDRVCDFTFVSDVVRGICLAGIRREAVGRTVDLGTGTGTTIREMARILAEVCNATVAPSFAQESDRVAQPTQVCDAAVANSLLGWKASWLLRDGLRETVDAYRQHAGLGQ